MNYIFIQEKCLLLNFPRQYALCYQSAMPMTWLCKVSVLFVVVFPIFILSEYASSLSDAHTPN